MRVLLLISILMLGACARQPEEALLPMSWARADRQPVNSALLDIDLIGCKDEMQGPDGATRGKADMVDDFVSCMREHGYVQIKS
jgi:hypothetical protein